MPVTLATLGNEQACKDYYSNENDISIILNFVVQAVAVAATSRKKEVLAAMGWDGCDGKHGF